jgi:hypothetical protein
MVHPTSACNSLLHAVHASLGDVPYDQQSLLPQCTHSTRKTRHILYAVQARRAAPDTKSFSSQVSVVTPIAVKPRSKGAATHCTSAAIRTNCPVNSPSFEFRWCTLQQYSSTATVWLISMQSTCSTSGQPTGNETSTHAGLVIECCSL